MTDRQIMDGYAIIPPVSHWYEKHRRQIELDNARQALEGDDQ